MYNGSLDTQYLLFLLQHAQHLRLNQKIIETKKMKRQLTVTKFYHKVPKRIPLGDAFGTMSRRDAVGEPLLRSQKISLAEFAPQRHFVADG